MIKIEIESKIENTDSEIEIVAKTDNSTVLGEEIGSVNFSRRVKGENLIGRVYRGLAGDLPLGFVVFNSPSNGENIIVPVAKTDLSGLMDDKALRANIRATVYSHPCWRNKLMRGPGNQGGTD